VTAALSPADFAAYARRFEWYRKVRPMALASVCLRLFAPPDRRRVVELASGLKLWLDPVSILGRDIAADGTFEPETAAILDAELKPGDAFIDIGANEGVFSAHAGRIVGASGKVIAVEPQQRLREVIETNLRLNDLGQAVVFSRAVGEASGVVKDFKLYPEMNSGASSFVRGPRSGAKRVPVQFVSPEDILAEAKVDHADLVKVDVEGYEGRVIDALLPLIRAGRIRKLLVDYHAPVLKQSGINPADLHHRLVDGRMVYASATAPPLSGYHLYRLAATISA
jgi:FkbM family methyltransferase